MNAFLYKSVLFNLVLGTIYCSISFSKPLVGIQYLTWFDYQNPGSGCLGNGWREKPFKIENVRSLAFSPDPNGYCYSSMDPHTAEVHAGLFKDLGIDFVIFDESNFSKTTIAANNPTFRAAKQAMIGFRNYKPYKVRTVFQLSITCWGEQCFELPGDKIERFTYNSNIESHISEIATMAEQYPDDFIYVNQKPLILFYVSDGNVLNLDGSRAFHGPGGLLPTESEFNPSITVNGSTRKLRDIFTVRFTIVANSNFDYRPYSSEIWPFQCSYESCQFTEAGYLSVASVGTGSRNMNNFKNYFDTAANKQFYIVRSWNEFSSTDEDSSRAYTLEPNTQLHKNDGTPGHQDPWYFFNCVKEYLKKLKL